MRSDTLMPLKQFTDWWGFDPWYIAGIDYDGSSVGASAIRTDPYDQCDCMIQHPWYSQNNWCRDDFIEMLKMAEAMFVEESGYYPAPYYIEGEVRKFPFSGARGSSVLKYNGKPKTIQPKHACYLQAFGAYSLTLVDTVELTREDVDILDVFTATVVVPAGTLAEEIRVFFTAADGGYTADPEFNDHLFEIRPLTIEVDGVNATISGGAYLFKKPELDEELQCVLHELDTYVEDIAVYLVTVDSCDQGNYICYITDCEYLPCEPNRYSICMTTRVVGRQVWGAPYPAECNESLEHVTYCLSSIPEEIEYNYLNGVALASGGYMAYMYVQVLSKLAVGLADCIKKWCECINCPTKKPEYYRQTPHAMISLDKDRSQYDVGWQVVLSKNSIQMLDGLPPYIGILQALRFINKERCVAVEGALYG